MNTPPLVYCPTDGITCPLDGRQFSTFTQFWQHCRKKHTEVLEQEADTLTVSLLAKDLQKQQARDAEIAAVAAKVGPRKRKIA
jgi:hypothetical protein